MTIGQLPPRIAVKIEVNDDGCWIWTAVKDRRGYGKVHWKDGAKFSHRVVYEILVGDPGPELDHLCRVPACCNPEHLEPVTHSENVRRGESPKIISQRWSVDRLCPQGHPLSGDNLYVHVSEKYKRINRQCRTCRRENKRRRRAAGAAD